MLPDGRVLYTRWEYVDRSQVDYHHLWTMNPDGTQQMIYYGNLHPGTVMIGAKPIPNTDKVIAAFSPEHGTADRLGHLAIVSPKKGPDDRGSATILRRGSFKDPYPISEDCFLAADNSSAISIMDGEGRTEPLFTLPRELSDRGFVVFEPTPVGPRPREVIVGSRVDLSKDTGHVVLQDVYRGRMMQGVEPDSIKKLLVLRQLPKPINFTGSTEPITIGGSFTLAEILGTIPVAEDGSAFAELPALQALFFVALDENDLAVKRMQSFMTLQPGETMACIGCHEERIDAPSHLTRTPMLQATRRAAAVPQPIPGVPSIIDYPRDVQPILDRHCISCHSPENYGGKLDLTGDKTAIHSMSYIRLTLQGQWVVDNRNQAKSNYEPYKLGSGASTLLKYIEPEHYDVNLSQEEKNMIRLWIDVSATYPGTYAAMNTGVYHATINYESLLQRCGECHHTPQTWENHRPSKSWFQPSSSMGWHFPRHHMSYTVTHGDYGGGGNIADGGTFINISRPEQSFLLRAPLAKEAGGLGICSRIVFESKDDPLYRELLQSIELAHHQLQVGKRYGMPGFRPHNDYIREMQKYGFVKKDLGPDELFDYNQAEREYFDSFYYDPAIRDIRSAGIR